MPELYPIYLNLEGRPCLVVGAGAVAWRKAEGLLRAGARVTVVAPSTCAELRAAAGRGELQLIEREAGAEVLGGLLDGAALCVAATDDRVVNAAVAAEARRRNVPVNVVDAPDLCDFEAPAVLGRGGFQIAVSTGGASPLLAARVRRELEDRYGPEYAELVAALSRVREDLHRSCPDAASRRPRLEAALEAALGPEARRAAAEGRAGEAEDLIRAAAGLETGRLWRVGTRGSELALRQTALAVEALRRAVPGRFETVVVRTSGDKDQEHALADLGSVGAFTGELERALEDGRIDFAVHSLKDLPTYLPPGLVLAAVVGRADPREAFISRSGAGLDELPPGAVVGTSSPRREALIRRHRPDLVCRPLRGNVDTRLRRLEAGDFDAIILAAAGLERLGLAARVTAFLDPAVFVPAAAQGLLALECRADDAGARALGALVEDRSARLAAEAERAFLARLGAGCHAAAGALARYDAATARLEIHGLVLGPDGREAVEGRARAEVRPGEASPGFAPAADLGASLAADLLARGAARLVAAAPRSPGRVYLVGAGPGDPGLLTLRGAALLRRARCVVIDRLANPSLLELVPPDCEVIPVGKEPGRHSVPQEEISRILVDKAREGLDVVRLKGGDPFVFGRGGEEAQALRAAGIRYEVVPGVTSAVAGPAMAGIPVTHRGKAQSVAFATGTSADGNGHLPDFGALAGAAETLVVLMGTRRLGEIVGKMRAGGCPADTPAAVVASASTADQRTVTGTLADIVARAEAAGIENPALIIAGDVAGLRRELAWREDLPLHGRRVVVTRSREQASALAERLEELGADVLRFPAIRAERLPEGSEQARRLDEAIGRLEAFDWIVLSSVNGVDHFFERLAARGRDARALARCRVAAIGPATAERLLARGLRADLIPSEYRGEALAETLAGAASAGERVLLVRSDLGRPSVVQEMTRRGLVVEEVHAYQLEPGPETPAQRVILAELRALLAEGRVDALTFASSATVRNFIRAVGREALAAAPRRPAVFCIGPVTAATARESGLEVTAVASSYTIDGLVEAVREYYVRDDAQERKEPRC